MNHFEYRDGILHAENVSIPEIAAAVGTPFYCYSTATIERQGDVSVVHLDESYGSAEIARLEEVRNLMAGVAAQPGARVVIDFEHATFFGSSLVGLLFQTQKELEERGGSMAICAANADCEQVLRTVRLDLLVPLYHTRAEAITALEKAAGSA